MVDNKTLIPGFTKEEQEKYNPVYWMEGGKLTMVITVDNVERYKTYMLDGYGCNVERDESMLNSCLEKGVVSLRRWLTGGAENG